MSHRTLASLTSFALAAASAAAQVPGATSAGNPTVATQRVATDAPAPAPPGRDDAAGLRLDLGVPICVDRNVQGDHEVLHAQAAPRY